MSQGPEARPVVDVVLPMYNGQAFVRSAIESALAQEGVAGRVIAVDDGSTDGSADIAGSFGPRVEVLRQANRGVSGARNAGIRSSSAPYIALLDQDDVWMPGKLARQVRLLERFRDVGLVFSDMITVDGSGRPADDGFLRATPGYVGLDRERIDDTAFLLSTRVAVAILPFNFVSPSSVLLRREAAKEEEFDESLRLCDDAERWMRLLTRWRAIAIEEPLVRYRLWGGNASLQTAEMLWERVAIADKVFAAPWRYHPDARDYFRREQAACLYRLGTLRLRAGDSREARRLFTRSLRRRPRGRTALLLAATAFGPRTRSALIRVREILGIRLAPRLE